MWRAGGHCGFGQNGSSGFTLVELLVVMAIVGLLATVAVPNYMKYAALAKRSEAKVSLAAVYLAEQGFFLDSGSYTTCLSVIGYKPESGTRYYTVGFHDVDFYLSTCGPSTWQSCGQVEWGPGATFCVPSAGPGINYFPATARANAINPLPGAAEISAVHTNVTTTSFIAVAIGAVSADPPDAATYDLLSIDNTKSLVQEVSAL